MYALVFSENIFLLLKNAAICSLSRYSKTDIKFSQFASSVGSLEYCVCRDLLFNGVHYTETIVSLFNP